MQNEQEPKYTITTDPEGLLNDYNWAREHARDSEQRLSGLVNGLLIGNSFLVAAFAVILGQPICNVVLWIVASVGLVLCLLILLGFNRAWLMYEAHASEAHTLYQRLHGSPPPPFAGRKDSKPWVSGWNVDDLLGLYNIYQFWLPGLFILMWTMLMVFAIK